MFDETRGFFDCVWYILEMLERKNGGLGETWGKLEGFWRGERRRKTACVPNRGALTRPTTAQSMYVLCHLCKLSLYLFYFFLLSNEKITGGNN